MEAGLHYNWHRHYDPSLGRYTQPDPLGFVDGPNVFSYALSSPYRYVDKDGRFVQFVIPAIPELITMITTIGVWLTLPDPPDLTPEPPKPPQQKPATRGQSHELGEILQRLAQADAALTRDRRYQLLET